MFCAEVREARKVMTLCVTLSFNIPVITRDTWFDEGCDAEWLEPCGVRLPGLLSQLGSSASYLTS